ncbi:colicin immunity protein [Tatumella sp. TA1]|uniref:colicin immunity domain-containing protein n=1 Tax=Rosenbergiella collisarenosi TaxID=1544695 RepID=UPI0008F93DE7|nr:colicin immunity domain-containing protein [Rosenbergiella collisarenosi]MBT0720773.1 colicin immunity protein [Rosenbergiella collisarenosi]QGX91411.1 colicin immunity protein [Tatumella sp. TA1]
MSNLILDFAKSFTEERLSANAFAEAYIELWRIERDNKNILNYEERVSECLSSIFCLADLYNPDSDKDDYELNDEQLRDKILELFNTLK